MSIFVCKSCDFKCCKQQDYTRHISTRKHQLRTTLNEKNSQNIFQCKSCEKIYKARNSLWYHEQKCPKRDFLKPDDGSFLNNGSNLDINFIMNIIKQNQEFKDLIIDQQQDVQRQIRQQQESQKQIMEMVKNAPTSHIINNHQKITNNTQFNLNFFLNETCKDAMNIYQFMESIQIQLDDLDYTGENGYVAGVSRIFLRELKKLDVCKRPIHCTDVKREVFHVKNKDNHWGKERNLLITAIKEITRKNVVHLNEWREAYPGCMDYFNKKNNQYLKIQSEILGSADSEEDLKFYNKIISTVAKETMLDKKNMMTITECD